MEPNKTNRNTQPRRTAEKQPSLREQANARMREASVKKASTQRTAQSSSKDITPAKKASAQQSSSAKAQRATRPSSNVKRERPADTVRRERPAAKDAIRTERTATRPSSRRKKKKSPIFWIALAIYTVALLIFSGIFLIYTDKSLAKYENSQSEHFMDDYIKTFEDNVRNDSFAESDFSFGDLDMTFANTSSILNDYLADAKNVSEFSFEKDSSSYLTEAPVYTILGDGEPLAKVSLEGINPTKIFAILTIMDWNVDSLSPICQIDVSDMTFNVPEGYTPVIGGKTVDASYQTGNKSVFPEFVNVAEYVSMPSSVEYKVSNVLASSEINVLDTNGNPVSFTQNGNVITALYSTGESTLTDERKEESLKMVQTYEDIMTDDLGGGDHGFSKVATFLIKDSYYYNYVKQWTTGVDITFTSAHRFDDPKYSDVVVDNYVEYADNCYSLHVSFTKNMVFTKRDGKFSNDFDSTVFFVNYDDTDDGIDNPHWCIVDIIATTNN